MRHSSRLLRSGAAVQRTLLGLLVALSTQQLYAGPPANVRAVPLSELLTIPQFSAPATVVARNQPQIAAEIQARVVELPAEVGDRVGAGEVLARLDCRRYESALAQARAELARARAQRQFADEQLRRARNLTKKQSISEELLDQRRTDLASADADSAVQDAAVARAAIDVEDCVIRAPFAAVVTARAASIGSLATPGNVLFTLLQTDGQEDSVTLRHDQVTSLLDAGALNFDSNGTTYPLQLRTVLPAADPVARTREARLRFAAEPALAGSAGRVVWEGRERELPPDYLVRRQGELGVFLLEADTARFVPVAGAENGRPATVRLPTDSLVVTDGRQRLADGDPVRRIAAAEGP